MSGREDRVAELFGGLRHDAGPSFSGAGPEAVAAAGRRRRRTRLVVLAAVVAVVTAGGVAVVGIDRPQTLRPVQPPTPSVASPAPSGPSPSGPSPSGQSPSGSSEPAASLTTTDWKNAVLDLPVYGVCSADRLRFTAGTAMFESGQWGRLKYRMLPDSEPEYGDVTNDGRPDAVVAFDCVGTGEGSRITEYQPAVAVYTANARGGPQLLGLVAQINPQSTGPRYWIEDGAIVVDHNEVNSADGVHTYRWDGSRFTES
ncbi:hypothetical protein [Cryptosporangium japonicum]|uniref:Uncharacterized protein n=1 Tax=Cryptosporangium japonicum TaxID=80872 RepID=A0ABN0UMY4_9ACTN